MNGKQYFAIMLAIFLLASGLRLGFAFVNKGAANDNHFEVSHLISTQGRLPDRTECDQCYHPKFFHASAAMGWKLLGPQAERPMSKVVFGQMLNAFAGIGIIIFIWLFLHILPVSPRAKVFTFSLIALNGPLIVINGMFSNDSFAIFFTTMTLYFLYRYLSEGRERLFWLMALGAACAGISKGNGFVLFIGITAVFILQLIAGWGWEYKFRKECLSHVLIFWIAFAVVAGMVGQYYSSQRPLYKNLSMQMTRPPRAPLLGADYLKEDMGVTSVVNSIFTFRLADLLKHPYNLNPINPGMVAPEPWHKTSLWTQIYARTHFIYFEKTGSLWAMNDERIFNVARIIFVLALFPTLLILWGVVKRTCAWIKAFASRDWGFIVKGSAWIFEIFLAGYLLFIIIFAVLYRQNCFMKAIYIFPGLLTVAYFLGTEISSFYGSMKGRAVRLAADTVLTSLVVLHVVMAGHLIYQCVINPELFLVRYY